MSCWEVGLPSPHLQIASNTFFVACFEGTNIGANLISLLLLVTSVERLLQVVHLQVLHLKAVHL